MTRRSLIAVLIAGAALWVGACGKLGPQKRDAEPPAQNNKALYEVDLSKPDGPMYQILRAAQDRNIDLFRQSFAPSVDIAHVNEQGFGKFRRKVLRNKMTPVPESVQQVSDTEAIVKLRNGKGKELPVHVQKFGDKWLITGFDFGPRLKNRFEEKQRQAQGATNGATS